MANATTSNMIVAMSVVALLVFFSALWKVLRRGEWSSTATLAALIAMLSITSIEIVVTYLDQWRKVTDVFLVTYWAMPGLAHAVWRVLSLALGAMAVVVFLVRAKRRGVPLNAPAVLFVVVALILFASSLLHGDSPFRPMSMVYLMLLIACTVAPRGLGIHVGIATYCTVIAVASGLTFLAHKDFSVFPCATDTVYITGGSPDAPDKCGILGFNFQGVMENENALALYFALAMPFVYIGFGSWEGATLCAYMLGLILFTGSRSGAYAGVITFVALILLRPNIRRPTAAPIRSWLLYLGLAAAFIVGIVLPFTAHDPTAYHGRAYLWSLARQALSNPADLWHGTGMLSHTWTSVAD